MPSRTLVSYTDRLSQVVDFRAGYAADRCHCLVDEYLFNWRELWLNQSLDPPRLVLDGEPLVQSVEGILITSTLASGGAIPAVLNEQLVADEKL